MLRANLRGPRGRVKRWDYWCVITPDVVASFTYADIDYAGLANCWVLDRHDHRETTAGVLRPFSRGFELPEQVCTGTAAIAKRTPIAATPAPSIAYDPDAFAGMISNRTAGDGSRRRATAPRM